MSWRVRPHSGRRSLGNAQPEMRKSDGNAQPCPPIRVVIALLDMLKTLVAVALIVPSLPAQSITDLSLDQKEEFLRVAAMKQVRGSKKGVTGTKRATLSDGTTTHDASIQRIDEEHAKYETARGTE